MLWYHGQLGISLVFPPHWFPVQSYKPYAIRCAGPNSGQYLAYVLRLILVSTLQQHGRGMCSPPTCHVTNVRPSINSLHLELVSRPTPECQCLWFEFYRASNFHCMAIAAELLSPTGPPWTADWVAASVAAALERASPPPLLLPPPPLPSAMPPQNCHPHLADGPFGQEG